MARSYSVVELFDRIRSEVKPSKPWVVGRGESLTYGDLFDRVDRLTGFFDAIGLRAGDRAVIASEHDLSVLSLFMALWRNGITAVILNPRATPRELGALLAAADARAVFADARLTEHAALRPLLDGDGAAVPIAPEAKRKTLSLFRKAAPEADAGEASFPALLAACPTDVAPPDDLPDSTVAYILFTSGTMSRPKGVQITHRNLLAQMETFVRQYGYDAGSRILDVLPLYHTDGLTQGPVVAFTAAATAFRPLQFRVDALPELLDGVYAHRITHFVTVPSVLALMVNLGEDYLDCLQTDDFRFVISTAAFLDQGLWTRFEELFEVQVVNVYGLTETVCEALYCGPDEATRRVGSIGKPVDCEARILGPDGAPVAPGEVGELALRGDNVMPGYFRMPEETSAVLSDGWFRTGDLARQDEDGFFYIAGRQKDVIITAGQNVYPEDVTAALRSLPGVLDAVTFGVEDATWGERVVSCVIPAPGTEIDETALAQGFLEIASREKLPREIHVVDELPRGPAGKVIVARARELVKRRGAAAPQRHDGQVETRLLEAAASVFKMPVAALTPEATPDNTKGWSSLAHVELMLAIEQEFEMRLTPQDIMNLRSIKDALSIVRARAAAAP